jgi:oxygen-independent coproporphyrinogen-3 oxidase
MSAAADQALGLYISIPFCRSKCTYCNFASGVYPASDHERYVSRLVEDLRSARQWANEMGASLPERMDTVYLGGGTPSLLAPELIERLFAGIRSEFEVDPEAEITVECAPGQIAESTLEAMAQAGVNRISLGVQSFIDREAQVSGRLHTRASVLETVARLRAAGISNLSVDLIAGLASQTEASWDESLAVLTKLGVPHASVYMLEVDEDSRLGREVLAGGARYFAESVPSDDAIARMYGVALERLNASGLAQYEISNFSRPGFESRHNLRYWKRRPYLGLGLDASSALYAGEGASADNSAPRDRRGFLLRSTTTDDLKAYLTGQQDVESQWLSPDRQHEEAWFLGLRMNAGIDAAEIEREFGRERAQKAMEAVARLRADGLLAVTGQTVRLTDRGRLLSNDVFQEFLEDAAVAPTAG